MAGGWPGTLPEAKARVATYFERELARLEMVQLTADELASATRIAYDKAKHDWLRAQVPD